MGQLIEEYKNLILERDEALSDAEQADQRYIFEFGEINIQIFKESIECIKLKKSIEYCLKCINNNNPVNVDAIKDIVQLVDDINLGKITKMKERHKYAKRARNISLREVEAIKKLYRKLAKVFHPDVNSICAEEMELIEIWSKIYDAYMRSDFKALVECEVIAAELAKKYNLKEIEVDCDNLEDKISEIEIEIQNIVTNEPYTYRDLFANEDAVKARHTELEEMLMDYKNYRAELQKTYDNIFEEKGGTFTWTMN